MRIKIQYPLKTPLRFERPQGQLNFTSINNALPKENVTIEKKKSSCIYYEDRNLPSIGTFLRSERP